MSAALFSEVSRWQCANQQALLFSCTSSLREMLLARDILLYCGHGAGERFIRREVLRKLDHCGVVLLMGCSSGKLHLNGDFEPAGMAVAFSAAGCPALVANLWDVTDKDIDRFTEVLVASWESGPAGRSLLEALSESRDACKFRALTGFAPVCYGVPVSSSYHGWCGGVSGRRAGHGP